MRERIEHHVRKEERKPELVPLKTVFGEAKAWETLSELRPENVCFNAGVSFDPSSRSYAVRCFGIEFLVSPENRTIESRDAKSALFLDRYKDFFRLSVLWYLTSAKNIPATGRLIRPLDVKGGQRFFSGTHLLPLDRIEERFGRDKPAFVERGLRFGAELVRYGDAAVRLYPLPRVPVTVILWLEDEEYPARVTLFFDSTVDFQLSLSDIVWSVALMASLVMGE
ncbi:MAG TPA: DUF3786 domain-containing protein [Nitrospirota bacterium]|nr:DUF3786 domain-containing protein [Nitrospirota bacterium]